MASGCATLLAVTDETTTRTLGRSGIEVSAVGLGCWAIGGPVWRGTDPSGWGQVDDAESIRAVRRGLELGATLFDTADVYGAGHSERILGQALGSDRDDIAIATKFGITFEEESKQITGTDATPDYIRRACDASLARLGTDRIDLYQLHIAGLEAGEADDAREVLEDLVSAGKIRSYGWSTDDHDRIAQFAKGPSCAAAQVGFSLFGGNDEAMATCERQGLAALIRGPLAMGLLTGKFTADTKLADDDVRRGWDFASGDLAARREAVDRLRQVLGRDGRTLAQGALAWLLARSEAAVPIPGFKSVAQVEDNLGVLRRGPLSGEEMAEVQAILQEG